MIWKTQTALVNVGFIFAFAILLTLSIISYKLYLKSLDDEKQVVHTYQVLESSKELLSNLKDAETGSRGFIITGNEDFLKPYHHAVKQNTRLIQTLRHLTEDNPTQQGRCLAIEKLIQARLTFALKTITSRREKGFDATEDLIETQVGKKLMDEIRTVSLLIDKEEMDLLRKRKARAQSNKAIIEPVLRNGIFISAIVFLALFYVMQRQIWLRRKTEEELFIKNEWFNQTLVSLGDGVITTDTNGLITLINDAACDISRWEKNDALGQPIEAVFDIYNESSGLKVKNPAIEALEQNTIIFLANHTILKAKDGSQVYIDDSGAPIHNTKGETIGAVLIFRDITDRKRAERELDMFFKISEDMIGIAGTDGYFKRINQSFTKLLGFTEAEILSRTFAELVHPDDIEATQKQVENLSKGIATCNFNNRYLCKDGSYRWLEWNVSPNAGTLYALARDTTARKQAEEEINKLKSFFESIFENIPSMVLIKDPENLKISRINQAAENILGVPRNDMIGKTDCDLYPAEQAELFRAQDREALSHGPLLTLPEERVRTREGDIWLQTKKIPILNMDGQVQFLLIISDDITVSRQLQLDIRMLNKGLEQKVQEKTEELMSKERRWTSTLDNLMEGVCVVGFDWRLLYVNKALVKQARSSKNELQGNLLTDLYPGIEHTDLFRKLEASMVERVISNIEYVSTSKNHTELAFELYIEPVPEGILILAVDISARKKGEKVRREYTEAIEEMMFITSHKIRQPVSQILGIAELLNYPIASSEELQNITGYMKESVNNLDSFTRELTTFINGLRIKN